MFDAISRKRRNIGGRTAIRSLLPVKDNISLQNKSSEYRRKVTCVCNVFVEWQLKEGTVFIGNVRSPGGTASLSPIQNNPTLADKTLEYRGKVTCVCNVFVDWQ